MKTFNSAYDGLKVSDIIEDPTQFADALQQSIEGSFIEEAVFTDGGVTPVPVFSYREEVAPLGMGDSAEDVAEFADIPASNLQLGEPKVAHTVKSGLGVNISREMIKSNDMATLSRSVQALQNEMVLKSVRDFSKALNSHEGIQSKQVAKAWNGKDATIIDDLLEAKETIDGAGVTADGEFHSFGYSADTLVISRSMANRIFAAEDIQKFYIGSVAGENPVYRGVLPQTLLGLNIVTSSYIDPTTAYVVQAGRVGIYRDFDPLTVTPEYAPHGENGYGGVNQAYRIDVFRNRGMAVTAPKAAVKLTGLK